MSIVVPCTCIASAQRVVEYIKWKNEVWGAVTYSAFRLVWDLVYSYIHFLLWKISADTVPCFLNISGVFSCFADESRLKIYQIVKWWPQEKYGKGWEKKKTDAPCLSFLYVLALLMKLELLQGTYGFEKKWFSSACCVSQSKTKLMAEASASVHLTVIILFTFPGNLKSLNCFIFCWSLLRNVLS